MKRTPRSPLRDVLARNLRRLRAMRGWSQERLAHEAGLNRTYLSAVERAEQNMSIDNLHKLSVALATPAGALLSEAAAGGSTADAEVGLAERRSARTVEASPRTEAAARPEARAAVGAEPSADKPKPRVRTRPSRTAAVEPASEALEAPEAAAPQPRRARARPKADGAG